MAPTKRKRRTKHRGTAAGNIQTRGRTGRAPSAAESGKDNRAKTREQRLNTPPTWRASAKRALLAAALLFLFVLVTTHSKNRLPAALTFALLSLILYVPAGYYLELFLYRRRQRKRVGGR